MTHICRQFGAHRQKASALLSVFAEVHPLDSLGGSLSEVPVFFADFGGTKLPAEEKNRRRNTTESLPRAVVSDAVRLYAIRKLVVPPRFQIAYLRYRNFSCFFYPPKPIVCHEETIPLFDHFLGPTFTNFVGEIDPEKVV